MEKFKTRQEIAREFGICVKTLNKIIEENDIKIEPRKLIKPYLQIELKIIIMGRSINSEILPKVRNNG
ncbi:MAG: hypothetical protein HC817_13195 [Saprospiraceae bacterium]|nr:hypothetical protein [Saprospiraceae bacterium]